MAGAGEHWYEFTVPAAATLHEASAIADFDSKLELRRGTCASNGAALFCRDTGFGSGVNPKFSGAQALAAGTYCAVVEGKAAPPVIRTIARRPASCRSLQSHAEVLNGAIRATAAGTPS